MNFCTKKPIKKEQLYKIVINGLIKKDGKTLYQRFHQVLIE